MMFLAAIDTTILTTAMPRIVKILGQAELYHWCFTAFMLMSTIALPFFGRMADQKGIRPCMFVAGGLFLSGSAACMFATSMPMLIAGRALQGLGASGLQSLPMIAFGLLFPPEQRGAKQSMISMVWGFSSLAGPVSGGLIVSYLSWQWIFGLNVLIGLIALMIFWFTFPHSDRAPQKLKLDWTGSALMSLSLSGFLLLSGQQIPSFNGVSWLAMIGLFAVFLWQQSKSTAPFIPLHPFQNISFRAACVLGFTTNLVGFAALTYVPLYLQGVLLQSPEQSGLILTPMMLAWPIASTVSGIQLNRLGFRNLLLMGGFFLTLSMSAWAGIAAGLPIPAMLLWCVCLGLGMGLVTPPLLIAVQTVVERHEIGVSSSTLVLIRNIGATLGVTVMGTLQVQSQASIGLQQALFWVFVCLGAFSLVSWIAAFSMPNLGPQALKEQAEKITTS